MVLVPEYDREHTLAMRLRSPLLPLVIFLAFGSSVPAWANSVEASAYSYDNSSVLSFAEPFTTGNTQCTQTGTSSASCEAYTSSIRPSIFGDAFAQGSSSFGALSGDVSISGAVKSYSIAVASFSDDVIVTG